MAYTPFAPGSLERPTTSVGRLCESNWINCQFPMMSSCQGGISAAGAIAPATVAAAFVGTIDGFPGAAGAARLVDVTDNVGGLVDAELGGASADCTTVEGMIDVIDCCGLLIGMGTIAVGTLAWTVRGANGVDVAGTVGDVAAGVDETTVVEASKFSLLPMRPFMIRAKNPISSTAIRNGLELRKAIYIGSDKFSSFRMSSFLGTVACSLSFC